MESLLSTKSKEVTEIMCKYCNYYFLYFTEIVLNWYFYKVAMENVIVHTKNEQRNSDTSWRYAIASFRNLRYQTSNNIKIENAKLLKEKEDEENLIKNINAKIEAESAEEKLNEIDHKKHENIALVANVMKVAMEATSHLSKEDSSKITAALILALTEK